MSRVFVLFAVSGGLCCLRFGWFLLFAVSGGLCCLPFRVVCVGNVLCGSCW